MPRPVGQSMATESRPRPAGGPDHLDGLVTLLDIIRARPASTRPELARLSGLGRSVVAQRLSQLVDRGLVVEVGLAASTGGRAPREIRLHAGAGRLLVASLGATSVDVALADLAGQLLAEHSEPMQISRGPDEVLGQVEQMFDSLMAQIGDQSGPLWGIGVGLPAPVEFATGRPIAPPIMPGWDAYPVRQRLAQRYDVPTWVDKDTNVMALGELKAGAARNERDAVFVKIGSGIGAGLITSGRLHRGAQGAAGDMGHVAVAEGGDVVCRCGNHGCLEALAGGYALGRRAATAAADGHSSFLAEVAATGVQLEAAHVARGAAHGDPFCVDLLLNAGRMIGAVLATFVNLYNPSLIVLGGGVAGAGDSLLASIRQSVYRRSLPLATRDLRIVRSRLGDKAGTIGAAALVVDELFSRSRLGLWLPYGSPKGRTDLTESDNAA
jgi:glucokinase-like ROK family protein